MDLEVCKKPPARGGGVITYNSCRDLPRMENNSRPRETKESKATEDPLDIPPDSPLGRMLRFLGDNPHTRDKIETKDDQILLFYMASRPNHRPLSFGPSLIQMKTG